MNHIITPTSKKEFEEYYQLRWQVLRAPWQQAKGSEQDELEGCSFHRAIIAENGELLAIGRLHFADQHVAQVRYVAVNPNHQGKGLGKVLMHELQQVAQLYGATTIELNARENALAFYQSLGYENLGQSHVLYDEIVHYKMCKPITLVGNSLSATLEQTWHQTIPLSKAMNIRIAHFNQQQLITSCDAAFNKNLHNTMFAGSIYTLATLTGWGWVYCQIAQANLNADIVLADANIRYHQPVAGNAQGYTDTSLAALVVKEQGQTLEQLMADRGKAKFTIEVQIKCGDKVAATFSGLYFAVAAKPH